MNNCRIGGFRIVAPRRALGTETVRDAVASWVRMNRSMSEP